MSFGYQKRRPLTEEEKSSDVAKARARALETLAAQEVSSGQLYERLCRRFTEQAAAEVVAEMVQREYVNDERYAEARAHSVPRDSWVFRWKQPAGSVAAISSPGCTPAISTLTYSKSPNWHSVLARA